MPCRQIYRIAFNKLNNTALLQSTHGSEPIMMRTSTFWQFLALPLLAVSAIAGAQTPAKPSDAPPKLEQIEEVGDAPITVAPVAPRQQITEKREAGVVSEVKVSTGGSTYYMRPGTPGDPTNSQLRGPQWKVLEFDLGKKKQKQRDDDAADTTPEPPQPTK